jgi:hypothetical protein
MGRDKGAPRSGGDRVFYRLEMPNRKPEISDNGRKNKKLSAPRPSAQARQLFVIRGPLFASINSPPPPRVRRPGHENNEHGLPAKDGFRLTAES